jgi:hypothetical protein
MPKPERLWQTAILVVGAFLGILGWYLQTREKHLSNGVEPSKSGEARSSAPSLVGPLTRKSRDHHEGSSIVPVAEFVGGKRMLKPVLEFHPRAADEFQGRRISLDGAICERSATCGMAKACIDGMCGPCSEDSDCEIGEVCVLQNCLLRENVSCRFRAECPDPEQQLCIFNEDDSPGARANSTLRAFCHDMRLPLKEQAGAQVSDPSHGAGGSSWETHPDNHIGQMLGTLRHSRQ